MRVPFLGGYLKKQFWISSQGMDNFLVNIPNIWKFWNSFGALKSKIAPELYSKIAPELYTVCEA